MRVGEDLSRKGIDMGKPRNRFRDYNGEMRAPETNGIVSFRGIEDEFAKLDALRIALNPSARRWSACSLIFGDVERRSDAAPYRRNGSTTRSHPYTRATRSESSAMTRPPASLLVITTRP